MFKKIQKVVAGAVVLSAVVMGVPAGAVQAASVDFDKVEIHPVGSAATGKTQVQLGISSGGTAKNSVLIIGKNGTSKIVVKISLQRYGKESKKWSNVKTWDVTSQTAIVSCTKKYDLSKKGTYRCKVTGTITCNGKKETVTATSNNAKY